MSKRFFTKINKNGRLIIIDKECHIEVFDMTLACEVLNRLDLKLKTYNEQLGEQQATINEQNEAIEYLKTVIRYTLPNQMVADVFKEIGEEYE